MDTATAIQLIVQIGFEGAAYLAKRQAEGAAMDAAAWEHVRQLRAKTWADYEAEARGT